jgi:hypothetical protein
MGAPVPNVANTGIYALGPYLRGALRNPSAGPVHLQVTQVAGGLQFKTEQTNDAPTFAGAAVDVARLLAMLDIRTNNPVLSEPAIASLFTLGAAGGGHGFDTARVLDATAKKYYGMKGGDIPESNQNCVRYQTGDISMVVCWNRSDIAEGSAGDSWWYPNFPAVLDAARTNAWGASDLFPVYGMPSFGARQGCLALLTGGLWGRRGRQR